MFQKRKKPAVIKNQRQLNREIKKNDAKLQTFFEIEEIKSNFILTTTKQEQYFIKVTPYNLAVMPPRQIENLEESLCEVLSSIRFSETIALNSSQSYEENQLYLQSLAEQETDDTVRELDLLDIEHMDNIKLSMATSRAFYVKITCKANASEREKTKDINDAIQAFRENGFEVELSDKEELKRMLAHYLEQNTFEEHFPDYDGQQYGISENSSRELKLKNFVDLVSPSTMDFKHSSYYVIGDTFRSVFAIRSYAKSTQKQHLLRKLGECDGVVLHMYNTTLTSVQMSDAFKKAENRNKFNFSASKGMEEKAKSRSNLQDLNTIIEDTDRDNEAFISCAVFIEMIAESLDELKKLKRTVDGILAKEKIKKDTLYTQQRDGFVAAAPFGFNIFQTEFERVLPASSVGNLFPFSYSGKTDKRGLYIGKDVNGSNIIVDFDKRDGNKTNGHIAIFGNSGEGKSYLMKLLICIFRQQLKKVFSCDVDNENGKQTTKLGGTNINLLLGEFIINIMEPKIISLPDDEEKKIEFEARALLSRHISFIRSFFNVYKPELTSSQLDILELLLVKTYEKFGIDENTDFSSFTSEMFPILSDLYATAKNELDFYDEIAESSSEEMLYTKEALRALTLALNSICVGTNSYYFNGHTNIPNVNHVNFVINGISELSENLKNAIYFNMFSYMSHKFFVEGSTAVFLDELHEIIKSKIVVDYIRSFIKRGRKKDSNVVLASQNIDDLMLPGIIEYTRPLFSIPTHMFLFYPGKVQVEDFKAITGVSSTEYKLFGKSKRGFCFYICGNERYHVQIIAPPHKAVLFAESGGR